MRVSTRKLTPSFLSKIYHTSYFEVHRNPRMCHLLIADRQSERKLNIKRALQYYIFKNIF